MQYKKALKRLVPQPIRQPLRALVSSVAPHATNTISPLPLVAPVYQSMDGLSVPAGRGHLSFIAMPYTTQASQVEYLAQYLSKHSGGAIALIGDHPVRSLLGEYLARHYPSVEYIEFQQFECTDFGVLLAPPALGLSRKIKSVLLLCSNEHFMRYLRNLAHNVHFVGRVIIPATHDLEWPTLAFENARPIVEYVFPCAGTARFKPCFEHLLDRMQWHNTYSHSFVINSHVIHSSRQPDGSLNLPSLTDATEAIYWRARIMDYLQYLVVHEYINPQRFMDFSGSLVALMRDPRDIINSMFWLTRPEAEGSDETHILRIINGYTRLLPGHMTYAFQWPDAGLLVEGFVALSGMPNAFIIRFEDMHINEAAALKKLMVQLGFDPNPFVKFDDKAYETAAYLGSFEYQTGGKRKRNEDHKTNFSSNGVSTNARKGSVGDWRSSFTPAAVKRFKELTGDGLTRLGYEKDEHWNL